MQSLIDRMIEIIEPFEGHIEGDDARKIVTSLSSTHAIVPKEEYEETVRLLRRVGQLQKVKIDSAIDQHPGEQAAAWGDDWTALLEAIAVHIAKEASPNGR